MDLLWTRSGPGWTGGDGAVSAPLPDGRVLWLFGDTFLGTVGADGSRPPGSPMVRNTAVVQDGSELTTVAGGGTRPLFQTGRDDQWFWPGVPKAEGDAVRVFLARFERTGSGAWDYRFAGTSIATLSLPGLAVRSIAPGPAGPVAWGTGTLDDGDWTYVYGVEDRQAVKYLHVARAPRGHLLDAWEYYTGSGWSTDPAASARVFDQAAPLTSVVRVGDAYALIGQESFFGRHVYAWTAPTPVGTWAARRTIYTTPDLGADIYTYNPSAHPELSGDGGLLVSYNVNSFEFADVLADAAAYRPRFFRIPMSCLAAG
jgi:hypothetical protein